MMNKNMLKQAQQMQARLAAAQEEIASAKTEATAGGGMVKVTVIGGSKVDSIDIDPEVVDPEDVEMLQDLVLAAVNEAMDNAQKLASDKMGQITGGLNIPGLMWYYQQELESPKLTHGPVRHSTICNATSRKTNRGISQIAWNRT